MSSWIGSAAQACAAVSVEPADDTASVFETSSAARLDQVQRRLRLAQELFVGVRPRKIAGRLLGGSNGAGTAAIVEQPNKQQQQATPATQQTNGGAGQTTSSEPYRINLSREDAPGHVT